MPEQPKIQFTPAQAAAIRARGGSLLVSAAAGSGKTRVLVERVVGLITDPEHPADADSLLIMTFTNAAAAKLRADITARLAQEVRAHPGNTNLRRQQLLLQRASIGTVDAFACILCSSILPCSMYPLTLRPPRRPTLPALSRKHWPPRWRQPIRTPTSAPLPTCTTGAVPTARPGDAVLDLYHFTRALPHPAASLTAFAEMWQQEAPAAADRMGP